MKGLMRAVAVLGVLGSVGVARLSAQNAGMPLFTNPHYGTGIRLHLDLGMPATEISTDSIDNKTIQGGISFALGSFGVQALVAGNVADVKNCTSSPTVQCSDTYYSGALLAGLRLMGGPHSALAIAPFAGVGTDFSGLEIATGNPGPKTLSIPVGVSVGYTFGKLTLWGAPRYNYTKLTSCSGTCPDGTSDFRWAAGASLPLGPIGLRGAYDGGKVNGNNVSFFAVGISLGLGSQQ